MKNIFSPKLFTLFHGGIDKHQLIKDMLAGLVVGVVALPLSIAFAVACGVSPEKGIITAIVAGTVIALLGGSRVQIGGPTGAFIVVIVGIIEKYGINGLMVSTIMAGLMLIVFGMLRLGDLLKYFPHSLIIGFTSGIALVIFSTQLRDAFGLKIETVPAGFIVKWQLYFSMWDQVNIYALLITVGTILINIFTPRLVSKVPGSFIAIIFFTILVQVLGIPVTTIESFFGEIPRDIQVGIPQVEFGQLAGYLAPALTIALLGGIESLLSAVVSDGMFGGHHRSNTELIAQGIANVVTPFFGGIPATGALARTATNVKNGGRTPIAGIVHAITLLVIMVLLGRWAKLIPMSCLAGILILVAYNMSEWRSFIAICKSSYFDAIILLSTFSLTVFVDLTLAIEVGIVLSAILFMKRMADLSNKPLANHIDTDVIEDYSNIPKEISIYEISGPLFFATARKYAELIQQVGIKSKVLIIRMRHVTFIDLTGAKNLKDALKSLQEKKVEVILSGISPSLKTDLEKYGVSQYIKDIHYFDFFDMALDYAVIKLKMDEIISTGR